MTCLNCGMACQGRKCSTCMLIEAQEGEGTPAEIAERERGGGE